MTTQEARDYFESKNLSYNDITSGDICTLIMLLNRNLKKHNKEGKASICTLRMSEKIKAKYRSNGTIINCYLTINSHYFTRRECISFNTGGFIGFAGELDGSNTKPILAAFIEWVDSLVKA